MLSNHLLGHDMNGKFAQEGAKVFFGRSMLVLGFLMYSFMGLQLFNVPQIVDSTGMHVVAGSQHFSCQKDAFNYAMTATPWAGGADVWRRLTIASALKICTDSEYEDKCTGCTSSSPGNVPEAWCVSNCCEDDTASHCVDCSCKWSKVKLPDPVPPICPEVSAQYSKAMQGACQNFDIALSLNQNEVLLKAQPTTVPQTMSSFGAMLMFVLCILAPFVGGAAHDMQTVFWGMGGIDKPDLWLLHTPNLLMSICQYFFVLPTYVLVINIYSFCNIHDLSWGTRPVNGGSDDDDADGVSLKQRMEAQLASIAAARSGR
jgi:hypothetical protein